MPTECLFFLHGIVLFPHIHWNREDGRVVFTEKMRLHRPDADDRRDPLRPAATLLRHFKVAAGPQPY